jgi:hypothetical protein
MKKIASACALGLLAVLGIGAPAQAAGPDSRAFVWDRDQTVSTSGSVYLRFPTYCPDSFHAKIHFVRWKYASPAGRDVNIKWTALRIRPNHKLTIRYEGQVRTFAAKETTTRRFYDRGDTSAVAWDGSKAVHANFNWNSYAPKSRTAYACRAPEHLAGLFKKF